MPEGHEEQGLTKQQKMGVFMLSLFAVFAVGLGVLKIRNTLYAPFALNSDVPYATKEEIDTNEGLMYRDTDKDGLNDFDELYVYVTSPYLKDTDSDGISDKEEVEKGTNPACPEGQTCTDSILSGDGVPPVTSVAAATSTLGPPPSAAELETMLSNPTQIRKMLLEAGFDKTLLDKTSDADLIKMVQEALSATVTSTNINNP
jgi:hypothetical protein